jgi:hypothetical protein
MKMSSSLKVIGIVAMLFVLTGCANQSSSTPAPTISASASLTYVANSTCQTSQLSIVQGQVGGAMGHVGIAASAFQNISTTTCTLQGYPKLQMIDAAGSAVPTHVINGTSYTVVSRPDDVVVLSPGAQAMFDIGYSSQTGYGNAVCPTSAQVQITPPGSDQTISVPWILQPYGGPTIARLRCGEVTISPVFASPKR